MWILILRTEKPLTLKKLNSILADLKLEKLTLRNERTYLAIMRDDDDNLLGKRYGLGSGTLICTPAENGYCYQIDTVIADKSIVRDEDFLESWRNNNPDRFMSMAIREFIEGERVYIILHHQKQ